MKPSNRLPFMQQLAALQQQLPSTPIELTSGEIATQSESILIPPPGRWLRIQPNLCAIVTHPSGRLITYTMGEHYLDWDIRNYTIQYFDLHQQSITFPEIKSVSSDAWDVIFTMEVLWRVEVPLQILNIQKPRETIESICRSTVIDFIRTNNHDDLVSTPGQPPLATTRIADRIRAALSNNITLKGFEIIAVLIMDIKGDRRRTEVVQKSIVQKTEIDQAMLVQREQARLEGERLELEKQFLDQNQILAIKQAETNRLTAEEEDRLRLRKADITAIEAKTARDAQIQEIEIQRLAEQQRMQHEQILKAMEVRGQAFGQLASALLQTTAITGGIQPGIDGSNQEVLARALESLANMPSVTFCTTPMLPPKEAEVASSLHDRLIKELHEVHKLPGAETVGAKGIGPGLEQVEIVYLNLQIFMLCDESYPEKAPGEIRVRRNGDINWKEINLAWSKGMNLLKIVLEVVSKMYSSAKIDQITKRSNGPKRPESLAG